MQSFVRLLEKKFNVKIKTVIDENGVNWWAAYYCVCGRVGKEVCREKDLGTLQITLKLYLS